MAGLLRTISPLFGLSNWVTSSYISPSLVNPTNFFVDLLSNRPDSIFNSSNNKIKCFSQAFNFSKLTSSRNRLMIFGLNPVPLVVNPLFLFNVVWCGRLRSPLPRIYSYVLETKREKWSGSSKFANKNIWLFVKLLYQRQTSNAISSMFFPYHDQILKFNTLTIT